MQECQYQDSGLPSHHVHLVEGNRTVWLLCNPMISPGMATPHFNPWWPAAGGRRKLILMGPHRESRSTSQPYFSAYVAEEPQNSFHGNGASHEERSTASLALSRIISVANPKSGEARWTRTDTCQRMRMRRECQGCTVCVRHTATGEWMPA